MARLARWAALLLVVTFVTALVEPWFVRWLEIAGWYDDPTESMGSVVNWIARLIGTDAFPWVAGIVFGLGAGMWLDWFLRRFERSKAAKAVIAANPDFDDAYKNLTALAAHIATVKAFQFTKEQAEAEGRLDWAKQQILPYIALFAGSDLEEPLRWIRSPNDYVREILAFSQAGPIRESLVAVCDYAHEKLAETMRTMKATGALRIPLTQLGTAIEKRR